MLKVFSGLEKTTVTRVFTARDKLVDVPLTLCYVDDGDFTMDVTKGNTVVDEISKEVEQESYRLKTRTGLPQLVSVFLIPITRMERRKLSFMTRIPPRGIRGGLRKRGTYIFALVSDLSATSASIHAGHCRCSQTDSETHNPLAIHTAFF